MQVEFAVLGIPSGVTENMVLPIQFFLDQYTRRTEDYLHTVTWEQIHFEAVCQEM